jgi:hypothetical protein
MSGMASRNGLPDGLWAEVKSGDQHLRISAEVYARSYLAGVFDVTRKQKVAQELADDLDSAKRKAEELAARYLRYRGTDALVIVEWQLNAQRKAAS